jgi:hypothetical protein
MNSSDWLTATIVIAGIVAIPLYFLPTIIATKQKHEQLLGIVALNVFGFAGVTWVAAFIWALLPSRHAIKPS